jgi:hypothetical protein
MRRRRFLHAIAAGGALTVTGCLADGAPTGGTDEPTDTPHTDPGTDSGESGSTDTPHTDPGTDADDTASPEPRGSSGGSMGVSFSVRDQECGGQVDETTVSFDDGVTVSGTIWGNDACYTATLRDVSLEEGALTLVVAAESDAGTDRMCAQCITEISYEASVSVSGTDDPDVVRVVHVHGGERQTVTTVDTGSAAATTDS